MSNARKTYTASYAGTTSEITTARKIAWAAFYLLEDGTAKLGSFYAGSRANAERDARATYGINARRLGYTNWRVVPATVRVLDTAVSA